MSFVPLPKQAEPILTVAIEPKVPLEKHFEALRDGLALLNHADACVRVTLHDSGEILLAALGELHLERCLKDLREKFVPNVDFDVSKPLVMFRETLVYDAVHVDNGKAARSAAHGIETIPDKSITITVTARPLSRTTCDCITKNQDLLQKVHKGTEETVPNLKSELQAFYTELLATFHTNSDQLHYRAYDWGNDLHRIWAFGPNFSGGNILLNLVDDWDGFQSPYFRNNSSADDNSVNGGNSYYASLEKSILAGFQRATASWAHV